MESNSISTADMETHEKRTSLPAESGLWQPRFVLTLPFDKDGCSRWRTEIALQRTKKRWMWYSDARESQPALGTLSYLPVEIRAIIFEHALWCRPTLSADGLWEYDFRHGSPFNLTSYYFGFGRRKAIDQGVGHLRQVSSRIKMEYEDVFLTKTNFRFNEPHGLAEFLSRLTDAQKDRLACMTIGVTLALEMGSWISSVELLPGSMRRVDILLYKVIDRYRATTDSQELEHLRKIIQAAGTAAPEASMSLRSMAEEPLSHECQAIAEELRELSHPYRPL